MSLIRTENICHGPEDHYQTCNEKKVLAAVDCVTENDLYYKCHRIPEFHLPESELKHRRSVFPSDTALLRALYLATFEATQKWTSTQQSGIGRRYMVS